MRIFNTILSSRDIGIIIVILGIAIGVIAGITNTYARTERDKVRLYDAQGIMNALELYKNFYGALPETHERECDDWDIGSSVYGSENAFIPELAQKNILKPPVEKFGASKCSYRYRKFTNNGCGEHVSYAILGLKLEGTKKSYRVNDVIEQCYPDIYRWTSDPHWIAFMIRE